MAGGSEDNIKDDSSNEVDVKSGEAASRLRGFEYHFSQVTNVPYILDWQAILHAKIQTVKYRYLQPLNQMHQKLKHSLEQQELKPAELDRLKISESLLERIIALLNIKKSDLSRADEDKLAKYVDGMESFVSFNTRNEPLSWVLIPRWLEKGEHHAGYLQHSDPHTNFKIVSHTPKQVNFNSNFKNGAIVEKNRLLEDKVKALEENQTGTNSEVENTMEENRPLEDRVKALEEVMIQPHHGQLPTVQNLGEVNQLLEGRVMALELDRTRHKSEIDRFIEDQKKVLQNLASRIGETEPTVQKLREVNQLLEGRVVGLELDRTRQKSEIERFIEDQKKVLQNLAETEPTVQKLRDMNQLLEGRVMTLELDRTRQKSEIDRSIEDQQKVLQNLASRISKIEPKQYGLRKRKAGLES